MESCSEDTIANDVVWPLLTERLGFSVGYFAAEGLSYPTTADFDQDVDRRDHDLRGWIQRIAIAAAMPTPWRRSSVPTDRLRRVVHV